MKTHNCKMFEWEVDCGSCSPNGYDQIENFFITDFAEFLDTSSIDSASGYLLELSEYSPREMAAITVMIPDEIYDETKVDTLCEKADDIIDEHCGHWTFQQKEDEKIGVIK